MMQYSTTPGAQGICPTGFHIPTDAEYTILSDTILGGEEFAGDEIKSAGLCNGRTPCATSGFNGLLGGYDYSGSWYNLSSYGHFWTSSQSDTSESRRRLLGLTTAQVYRDAFGKTNGISVRCIKN